LSTDYQQARQRFYRLRCKKAAKSLKANGFEAVVAQDGQDAVQSVLDVISPEDVVGLPGTVTARQLQLQKALREQGNEVVEHWVEGSAEEIRQRRIRQLNSDVLLTGTNALTLDGKLVNIDGTGNRVAAMIFGPPRVVVVAGANKICHDKEEAVARAKRIAGPINALRLDTESPCAKTGYCVDCDSPNSICRITTVIDREPGQTEITVVLVPEQLGY